MVAVMAASLVSPREALTREIRVTSEHQAIWASSVVPSTEAGCASRAAGARAQWASQVTISTASAEASERAGW